MRHRLRWFSVIAMVVGLLVGSCGDAVYEEILTLRYWQAPTTGNPYLSEAYKDLDPAALVLEPLANYDDEGRLTPRLAADIPTLENGGIAEDLTAITLGVEIRHSLV